MKALGDGAQSTLEIAATWWLRAPSFSDGYTSVIDLTQRNLQFVTALAAAVGVLISLVRLGYSTDLREGLGIGRAYGVMAMVGATSTFAVTTLLSAGDSYSPWIVDQMSPGASSNAATQVITGTMLVGAGTGVGIVGGIVAVLASMLQVLLMIGRTACVVVLMGVLPTLAAGTATEAGMQRFKTASGWLLAAILYKPVAATIYGIGLALTHGTASASGGASDAKQATSQFLTGLTVLLLAVLALPAMVRFVMPLAGRVGGGAFSGGAAVGALATGAVVVTGVVATGGASAAAGGAVGKGAAAGVGRGARGAAARPASGAAVTAGGPAAQAPASGAATATGSALTSSRPSAASATPGSTSAARASAQRSATGDALARGANRAVQSSSQAADEMTDTEERGA